MKVVEVLSPGGPEVLQVGSRPRPAPGPGQVLIEVAAAGVNRADLLQRQGHYPAPPDAPDWPGLEVAGSIEDVGDGVAAVGGGDQVCALLPGGGYAEYVVVDARHVLPIPAGVSLIEAAGIMEAACTVWSNLDVLGARPGARILIHGGSGGIGSWAIQVAKAQGMWVATTASGPDRVRRCEQLGADLAIDHRKDDVVAEVVGAGSVDLILDILGAGALTANLQCLRPGGAMAIIGLQQGAVGELPLGLLLSKNLTIVGTTVRGRSAEDKARIVAAVRDQVWPLIPERVTPQIHATVPLDQATQAHRLLESGEVWGKVILTV